MIEVEFVVSPACDLGQAARLIEQAFAACELRIVMKGTLRSYPGCLHWHVKRGTMPGTLELTLWEPKHRIWANVQAARHALWIDEALLQLRRAVETALTHPRGNPL